MNKHTLKIIESIADIPAPEWNALTDNDPLLSHAFFLALQESTCATPKYGWKSQFLTLWQDGSLVGVMPLYLKMNSFGEHVFDFAWADAYRRHGLHYYPKLVCTMPFTPVTGRRLLAATSERRSLLLTSALSYAKDIGVSSLHCLFLNEADATEAQAQGMMLRQDVQFHWTNSGYRDFDEFHRICAVGRRPGGISSRDPWDDGQAGRLARARGRHCEAARLWFPRQDRFPHRRPACAGPLRRALTAQGKYDR